MKAALQQARSAVPTWPNHGQLGAALNTIARHARWVEHGRPVPQRDDLELAAAIEYVDVVGMWRWCADGLLVRALERSRSSGRALEPVDLDRLRRIGLRAHAALERLDARAAV